MENEEYCICDEMRLFFYNEVVDEQLEDGPVMVDYVFDVERIGKKFYILDVIYANGRPVVHLPLSSRIKSVTSVRWQRDFMEMQQYVPATEYVPGMFDQYEGIIIQNFEATYSSKDTKIYKVKKNRDSRFGSRRG